MGNMDQNQPNADRLVKINRDDLIKLMNLYSPESPNNILGLSTIANYIRWTKNTSDFADVTFYSLNGDLTDGTFVFKEQFQVYGDSLCESNGKLARLLKLLDYSNGVRFMHIRSKQYPIIVNLTNDRQMKRKVDHSNILYHIPKEIALNLNVQLSDDFYMRSLIADDVIEANNLWEYKYVGSDAFLLQLVKLNPSCGVFTKSSDELVSFVFQNYTGPIGMLHTKSEYRGQGLAKAAIANICKNIGNVGYGVTACVKPSNAASKTVFEKLGFRVIDCVYWVDTDSALKE